MSWFLYTGNVPVAVQRADGESVSVRPRTKVEASPAAVAHLAGSIRRCPPPRDAAPQPAPDPAPAQAKKAPIAMSVSEAKGIVRSADEAKLKIESKPKAEAVKAEAGGEPGDTEGEVAESKEEAPARPKRRRRRQKNDSSGT